MLQVERPLSTFNTQLLQQLHISCCYFDKSFNKSTIIKKKKKKKKKYHSTWVGAFFKNEHEHVFPT